MPSASESRSLDSQLAGGKTASSSDREDRNRSSATEAIQQSPKGFERYFDMPFGGRAPGKHIPKGFAHLGVAVMRICMNLPFRYHVDNRESLYTLAEKTGVVVIANHTSFLDVIFMYLAIRPRLWPRIIGRDSLFENKPRFAGWALSRVGVFPIKRDSADRTAIKRATRFLKDGEIVCIMPEGTRRGKSGKTPELHGGAALIARMGKAPILPMSVRNAENIKNKGQMIHFPKVTAEFGDPILVGDFDFLPKDKRLDGCIWYAMRECFAISKRCAPEDVDMKSLFPDSEDFSQVFADHPPEKHTSAELVEVLSQKS